jgi:hypothetical protein
LSQKSTGFCDKNAHQLFDLARFLSLERFRSSGKRAKRHGPLNASLSPVSLKNRRGCVTEWIAGAGFCFGSPSARRPRAMRADHRRLSGAGPENFEF